MSHLFFVDDTLLLGSATLEEATHLKHAITLYERVSGQLVNYDKSGVVFSPNCPVTLGDSILNILGMVRVSSHSKYLGLPSVFGWKKRDMFLNIIDRTQSKIEDWNGRLLSKGGKEVLIKSVLQAIPSYTMSCFMFPSSVLDDITRLVCKFWWGSKDGANKICRVSWRKITQKKIKGGLGFKNLERFNLVFLAKQGWRLLTPPSSLLGRVLKARYFPNTSFLQATLGSTLSFTWRGIIAAKEHLARGLGRTINSGQGTSILMDDWIPGHASAGLVQAGLNIPSDATVASLIDVSTGSWRTDLITDVFSQHLSMVILSIPLGNVHASDRWRWMPSNSGKFSVKSAYDFIFQHQQISAEPLIAVAPRKIWKNVWNLRVPPKIIHFICRCVYDALPFADTLARRGVEVDNSCPFCFEGPSNARHLFFCCTFVVSVWQRVDLLHAAELVAAEADVGQGFSKVLSANNLNVDFFCIICYFIWYYRNRALFEGVTIDDIMVHRAAATLLTDYCNFNAWPERFPNSLGSRLWQKPPPKGLRVFFDGALSSHPAGGTGVFVTDETERFIYGASKFYFGICDPLIIEMLALRDALRLALELGLSLFSLLGDSQSTILAAIGEIDAPCICTAVLDEIKSLLLNMFFLGIFWVRRSENLVAHDLAFYAKSKLDCNESWSSIPDDLLSIRTG